MAESGWQNRASVSKGSLPAYAPAEKVSHPPVAKAPLAQDGAPARVDRETFAAFRTPPKGGPPAVVRSLPGADGAIAVNLPRPKPLGGCRHPAAARWTMNKGRRDELEGCRICRLALVRGNWQISETWAQAAAVAGMVLS